MHKPSNLYFRTKENGAVVFRVDLENRQKRMDLKQIASVNISKGKINPMGDMPPSNEELRDIQNWIEKRQAVMLERQTDDVRRLIDTINTTAHWLNNKADDNQLDLLADDLLLSMHDLRSVIVRRKSEQLKQK